MTPARRANPRAFTVIELMIALATASIVVSATMAMFYFLYNAESRMSRAAPQQTDLTIAHTVMMRTMGTLSAGVPLTPPDERDPDDDEETDPDEIDFEDLDIEDAELQEQLTQLFAGTVPEEALEEAAAIAFPAPPSQFELYYDDRNTGRPFQTLEVSLTVSPLPRTKSLLYEEPLDEFGEEIDRDFEESLRGVIRGAFEITQLHDGFALQWAWLDEPDLEPRILLRRVHNIFWQVLVQNDTDLDPNLPPKEWHEISAAYLAEDFPLACRLQIEMEDGSFIDWMFETAVTIPEQPN